jgi:uncharacterized protein (UPF0333 family)
MNKKKKRGQSTLEYVILITAIIAVAIVFLAPNGRMRTTVGNSYEDLADGMNTMTNRLTSTWNDL